MTTAVKVPCPECRGTGADPDEPMCACGMCMGSGHLYMNSTVQQEPIGDQPEPATICWTEGD